MSTMTVAVVQFCPEFGRRADNLDRIERLVAGTAADLYVLPELCTTGYFFTSRQVFQSLPSTSSRWAPRTSGLSVFSGMLSKTA